MYMLMNKSYNFSTYNFYYLFNNNNNLNNNFKEIIEILKIMSFNFYFNMNFFNKVRTLFSFILFLQNINFLVFNSSLLFRFNNFSNIFILIGFYEKNKFSWVTFNYTPFKFFVKFRPQFSLNLLFFKKAKKNNSHEILKNYVSFKKRTGLLKKKDKIKNFLLLRVNFFKNQKFFNQLYLGKNTNYYLMDLFIKKNVKTLNKLFIYQDNNKNIDMKRRWFKFFNKNRLLLKFILGIKKQKQFQITKIFSKISKGSVLANLMKFEFSLRNILVRSKLALNLNDAEFFIKNKLVYVNGLVANSDLVLNKGDVVSLVFSEKYFHFFKSSFSQKLKLTYSVGYRLWRLNRFKNNFYKQSPTGIPDWVFKISHFYDDVPSFIEVDYTILSLNLVKLPINYIDYNFYFMKFITPFLTRHYNWKYVN
jgi:hypothetical protein